MHKPLLGIRVPKNSYRISVTSADIHAGERHSCERCPVAVAASRTMDARVLVGVEVLSVEDPTVVGRTYEFSQRVADRIEEFDEFGQMRPFTFIAKAKNRYERILPLAPAKPKAGSADQ